MRLKLLTLDLDDTIWDAKPVLLNAEKKVMAYLQEHCPQLLQQFDRQALIEKRIAVYKARPDLRHQISQLRIEAVRSALQDSGFSDDDASHYSQEAFDVFIKARHDIELLPDAWEVLERLSQRFKLAALTNGNADVRKLEVGRFFSISATAEQLNASKPAPDHFEYAMREAGVKPDEVVHIGDHAEHDILGAQKLGIDTIWVNLKDEEWAHAHQPTLSITALADLPAAVDELL
jgi:putative hydrolase of the HAD superfamily